MCHVFSSVPFFPRAGCSTYHTLAFCRWSCSAAWWFPRCRLEAGGVRGEAFYFSNATNRRTGHEAFGNGNSWKETTTHGPRKDWFQKFSDLRTSVVRRTNKHLGAPTIALNVLWAIGPVRVRAFHVGFPVRFVILPRKPFQKLCLF